MTTIHIRERVAPPGEPNALVCIDRGPEYPTRISNPFSPGEERRLEWYFEEWVRFPFDGQAMATNAAASIAAYGEALFTMVFDHPHALAAYRSARSAEDGELRFEVAGSTEFHALHWETIRDPCEPHALVLDAAVVRQTASATAEPSMPLADAAVNVAIVTARPFGAADVAYRTISRVLLESLDPADAQVNMKVVSPGSFHALRALLEDARPGFYHLLHMDAHGTLLTYPEVLRGIGERRYVPATGDEEPEPFDGQRGFILLESAADGCAELVSAGELAALAVNHAVPMLVLNACQSAKEVGGAESSVAAQLVGAGVPAVLAMCYSVTVTAARQIMAELYPRLFAGEPLSEAIRAARRSLAERKERRAYFDEIIELEDWILPVLYERGTTSLRIRPPTADEAATRQGRREACVAPEPEYGFCGRDLDIHRIQKRLLSGRNTLLIRGMGGAGKTTLLQQLGTWWQLTSTVERVFYFGWDRRSWSVEQIVHQVARELLGTDAYNDGFVPLPGCEQERVLAEALRLTRHLLVLDNLESITGAHFAIRNTLDAGERERLRAFVAGLSGGKTLVLLGSRSPEEWLALGTFDDAVYELGGLDPEAASVLANRILTRHGAEAHRADPGLARLIEFLRGYPLALEVVLPNLATRAPAELLEALSSGEPLDSDDLTLRLLHCIDYSYGNLAPEMQEMVVALAPFVSVVDTRLFVTYAGNLRQLPRFAEASDERWTAFWQTMAAWGLLTPDPAVSWFLRIHPLLGYFIARKLGDDADLLKTLRHFHYVLFANSSMYLLNMLRDSHDQLRMAMEIVDREQENLHVAVEYGVREGLPFHPIFETLAEWMDRRTAFHEGAVWAAHVLSLLDVHPPRHELDKGGTVLAQGRLAVLYHLATFRLDRKEFSEAAEAYERLLVEIEHVPSNKRFVDRAARAHQQLGRIAEERCDYATSERHFEQALRRYREAGNRRAEGSLFHQWGILANQQAKFDEARRYAQTALDIYAEFGMVEQAIGALNQLAVIAIHQDQPEVALARLQSALDLCREAGNAQAYMVVLTNVGTFAGSTGNWELARAIFLQTVEHAREIQSPAVEAMTFQQLGYAALELGDLHQAALHLTRALELYTATQDSVGLAQVCRLHALGASRLREFTTATDWVLHALGLSHRMDDGRGIAEGWRLLAGIYRDSGDDRVLAQTAEFFEVPLDQARELIGVAMEEDEA